MRPNPGTAALLLLTFAMLGCSDSTAPVREPEVLVSWTFDADFDGWSTDVTTGGTWGTVTWLDRQGGVVKFDGVGFDGSPNAWMYVDVSLPTNAETLRYRSSAHDRNDGAASLRVRLVPAGAVSVTIQDWEELSTGAEGYEFIDSTIDISPWAGQTVTLYFEHADIDGGSNNQRYIAEIEIWS